MTTPFETAVNITGSTPIELSEVNVVWYVMEGSAYIYRLHRPTGRREYLFTLNEGSIAIGIASNEYTLLMTGASQAFLYRSQFEDFLRQDDFALLLVDWWVRQFSQAVLPSLPPRDYITPATDKVQSVDVGTTLRSQESVMWVTVESGNLCLEDDAECILTNGQTFPITPATWLTVTEPSTITCHETSLETIERDLSEFHEQILGVMQLQAERRQDYEEDQLEARQHINSLQLETSFAQLAAPFTDTIPERSALEAGNHLLTVYRRIGGHLGIKIREPNMQFSDARRDAYIRAINKSSRLRTRRVALRGEWWTSDNGTLLANMGDNKQLVALLPQSDGSYKLFDPTSEETLVVTSDVADSIDSFATMFYRTLPDEPLTGGNILAFGFRNTRRELGFILFVSLIGGVLTLLVPIVTGQIFSRVIPSGDLGTLALLVTVLLIAALTGAAVTVARVLMLLRVEARVDAAVQPAILDRVLELPATFFRDYQTGDLGSRILALTRIRQEISGAITTTLITALFSILNVMLLFWYAPQLALLVVSIITGFFIILLFLIRRQVQYERELAEKGGDLSGQLLGFLNSVNKLRVAGAENRTYAAWASLYGEQRLLAYRAGMFNVAIATFVSAFPLLVTIIVFAAIVYAENLNLTVGAFVAFSTALAQFLGNILSISQVITRILRLIPHYERAKPILEAAPEVDATKIDPSSLRGHIEIADLSFRYTPEGPMALENISMTFEPGKFIALVGASGSGKSTIMRLLLGFEKPTQGNIYYDRKDLSTLDIRAVRSQIGVVPQNGRLLDGSIYKNIVGSSGLTIDDAWEIAELVGLKQDIEAMPMGMHTIITGGGGTLSGGQRQRIMIARALVNKPRIILLDEATSALDNQTQLIVSESLDLLEATRIVIAHRLSTIINADIIYVLDEGRIVEQGRYGELLRKQGGAFAELAKRQLI